MEPLEKVETLEPVETVEKVETLEPVETVEKVETLEPVKTVEKVETLEPVETVEKVETLEPVEMVEKVETLEPVETVEKVETLEPVETVEKVETLEPVETVEKVETLEPVETVETMETMETMEPVEKVEKVYSVERVMEPTEIIESVEPVEVTERPPRKPAWRISKRVLSKWELLVYRAVVAKAMLLDLERASHYRGGSGRNSGKRHQQADIDAILQAADEIRKESVPVARICKFPMNIIASAVSWNNLTAHTQQKQGKVDRSQEARVIQDYYQRYRERNQIDALEAQMQTTDLFPQSENQGFEKYGRIEKLRRAYEISSILKDVIDAQLKEAEQNEQKDALGLHDTFKEWVEEDAAEGNTVAATLNKGLKFYNKLFNPPTNIQSEQRPNITDGSIKTLQMLVRILFLEEYRVPVSTGELDLFVLHVVEDLRNYSKIQHYPGTIVRTINGWGDVHGKVYEVVQKLGTALHWAVELKDVQMVTDILAAKIVDVNALNWMGCTALHMAVLNGSIDIVRVLLTCKDRMRLTEEDKGGRTPIQIAHNRGHIDIERALMECEAVRQYIQELYRDRQVYVDAANAILVGAALIASVTFASWLQPPLSYSFQGHVDVEHNEGLQVFWVFNSLSFYFAIGTVVCGARSVLPRQNIFIKQIVEKLRINLLVTSILLACSAFFVIIAFGIAGIIVLPPLLTFQWNMIAPTIVGGLVCVISLAFLFKNIWNESPMGNNKRIRFAKYLFDKS